MNQYTQELEVLFVEDDLSVSETFARILKRFFKNVHVLRNGEEGLAYYQQHQSEIDVVVTDVTMPKMSGIELAHGIRELDPDKIVIAFTAQYDSSAFKQVINETFDAVIPKTASREFVVDVFNQIGEQYHARRG